MKRGSFASRKVSTGWGGRPKARQMREIADGDLPVALAMNRVDQWVASPGTSYRVVTITCSTRSSVIVRGHLGGAHRSASPGPWRRTVPPPGDRGPTQPQLLGDRGVALALRAGEHGPGARRQRLGGLPVPCPRPQARRLLL